jgi:hypothetical protein
VYESNGTALLASVQTPSGSGTPSLHEYHVKLSSGRDLAVVAAAAPERDAGTGELHIYGSGSVAASMPQGGWLWFGRSARVMSARGRNVKVRLPPRPGVTRHPSGLTIRNADITRARPFRCVWDRRILAQYLNLLIGEEGIGKGNLVAWLAARLTRGELLGDFYGTPRPVAFIGDEDDWDRVWVPRLKAAGANLKLANQIKETPRGVVDIAKDAAILSEYIKSDQPALMFFDQLLDNLGAADSWKDKQVRDAISPLRRLVQDTDCALLAAMHPNKREGEFRNRISGTPAFNALSRSSLLIGRHPHEEDRTVVVRAKSNYLGTPPAFEFRIEEQELVVDGNVIKTSRITDTRDSGLTINDVLAAAGQSRRGESQAAQARRVLAAMFSNGEVRHAKQVLEQMDAEGFAERVTQAARRELGIDNWKEQRFQGAWLWGHHRPKLVAKRSKSQ